MRFNTDAVATLDELLEPSWDQPLGLEVRGWRMLHAAVLCCLGGGVNSACSLAVVLVVVAAAQQLVRACEPAGVPCMQWCGVWCA